MLEDSRLPSQTDFTCLSVPHLQFESCQHDATDHDAYSRGGSSSSVKSAEMEQDPYVPVNYISPEACALLAAAEASAARCAEAYMDASVVNIIANYPYSRMLCEMDGYRDPQRTLTSMAPPKKFYRTFWRSIAMRLLYRWTQEAKSSLASRVPMVA
jgi:hypothetical protein